MKALFISLLATLFFVSLNASVKIEKVNQGQEVFSVYGISFSNGFGGDGGFEFCFQRGDLKKSLVRLSREYCSNLIDLGMRWEKPTSKDKFEGELKPSQDKKMFEGYPPWGPDFNNISYLQMLDIKLGFKSPLFELFALNFGDHSIFKLAEKSQLNLDSATSRYYTAITEYAEISSSFLLDRSDLDNLLLSCKSENCKHRIQHVAYSNHDVTVIFLEYFDKTRSGSRFADILVHEAFVRRCHKAGRSQCLQEALYYDGILADIRKDGIGMLDKARRKDFENLVAEIKDQIEN